jgi:hypothetical protein
VGVQSDEADESDDSDEREDVGNGMVSSFPETVGWRESQ